MRKLRDYQEAFIAKIEDEMTRNMAIVAQLATGGGKTVCFATIVERYIKRTNKNVIIFVHRQELLKQTRKTLYDWYGIISQEVSADSKALNNYGIFGETPRVTVAMVETFSIRAKDTRFIEPLEKSTGLLIIDECHISNFKKIFEHFPLASRLGFSATPISATKKDPLKNWYNAIVEGVSIKDLIKLNKESPAEGVVQDLTWVRKTVDREKIIQKHKELNLFSPDRDFDQDIVGEEMSQPKMVQNVVSAYLKWANGKKTICFCSNVKHGMLVTKAFVDAGIEARFIDGKSKDAYRQETFKWLSKTPGAVLVNVGVATTGFDDPSIECGIVARMTKSITLWKQMVGRTARPYKFENGDYKRYHIVIDLGDNVIGSGHGEWSDDYDWNQAFYNPKMPKSGVPPCKLCPECGYINPVSAKMCLGEELNAFGDVVKCEYIFPNEKIVGEEKEFELMLITKDIDVAETMRILSTKAPYATFYDIIRQIAFFARKEYLYNSLTQDDYDRIYESGHIKILEWLRLSGKKNSGWTTDQYHKSLREQLEKQDFYLSNVEEREYKSLEAAEKYKQRINNFIKQNEE